MPALRRLCFCSDRHRLFHGGRELWVLPSSLVQSSAFPTSVPGRPRASKGFCRDEPPADYSLTLLDRSAVVCLHGSPLFLLLSREDQESGLFRPLSSVSSVLGE